MYIYYTYLKHSTDAEYYGCSQSSIAQGTGDGLPWHNPSECIWMVPGTVDPNDD